MLLEIILSFGIDKFLITMGLFSILDNVFRNLLLYLFLGKWINDIYYDILE